MSVMLHELIKLLHHAQVTDDVCIFRLGTSGGIGQTVITLSVYLSVRDHIFETTHPIFTKLCMRVTYGRGSVLFWRRCDML